MRYVFLFMFFLVLISAAVLLGSAIAYYDPYTFRPNHVRIHDLECATYNMHDFRRPNDCSAAQGTVR